MHSWHANSRCCRAKIYHFGSRRRQCSQCKRTWRIRKKQRGRKPRRARPGTLKAVLLDGRTLKTLAPRYGLTHQGLSRRFRGTLRQFTSRSRDLRLPKGPLVLVLDGLYFRFRGKDWVDLMAVKPCHQNRAIFLDPVLRKGRENMQGWSHAFTTIPPSIHRRIRASVSDEVSGIVKLGTSQGWIVQLCHFHLISRLQPPARGALSTDPPSSRASRWPSAPIGARSAQQSRSASKTTACHAHDRSRVSQADRPFQSLSQIPKIKSANYYRQPRSYEPKSS